MASPERVVRRVGTGLGATLLGFACLASLPARADLIPSTGLRSLGTTLRGENGAQVPGCSAGPCQVEGGTSRGKNLFHRFDQFDTRSGITRVNFQNGPHKSVIVGVMNHSYITVPISGQNRAGLFFLSPGGITISGSGGFTGWGNLMLTTRTNLAIGTNQFNAFTTVPDASSGWEANPVLEHASLSNDPLSLTNNGLSGNGPISVHGSLISVDRNLLIDSGNGGLSLQNATISAPTSATRFGEPPDVGTSFQGKTITATGSSITALRTVLQGEKVELSGTRVEAPRGLIRILGSDEIRVSDSQLLVAPQKPEDLYTLGLGYRDSSSGITVQRVVPGEINLQTTNPSGAGISLTRSLLDASTDLGGPAFASVDQSAIKLDLLAGTIALNAANGLSIDSSRIQSDSSENYAGQISLFSKGAAGIQIGNSHLHADSPNGSGDIDIESKGTTSINNSQLSANSTGILSGDDLFFYGFKPAGQARINSEGAIKLSDSTITTQYELTDAAIHTLDNNTDGLDSEDFETYYPAALIRLRSLDGIELLNSSLNASSDAGFAGSIELLAGTGGPIQVRGSEIRATAGDGTDIPLDFRDFVGSGGRINLYSGAGISIAASQQGTPSVLDANSAYASFPGQINLLNDSTTHPLALGPGTVLTATSAPGGFAGSTMLISSQGGLSLDGVSADTSGGSGGQITMVAKGGLAIASSQFTSTGSDLTTSPSTQLISVDGSPPVVTNDTLFTPDHATFIAAQSSDQLSPEDGSLFDLAAQQVQSLTDTLAYTYANGSEVFLENGPVSRSTWLSALLDQGRAPDFDLIIDNRDPNNTIITRIDQSKSISSRLATTSRQVDLANPEDVAALRSLLGEEVFNTVIWNPGEGSSGADLLANATPANVRQATGELTGQGNLEPARRAGDSATSEAPTPTPTLAVRTADALDPKKALESLDAGELTSLQAVSQALGLTGNLAKPPTILELQGYIKAAIEAIRQRQKSQAWNQGGSEAARIASVSTDQLLSAKASFDPDHYKPAILRYSFNARPAAAAPSSDGAKPPAMGLIDIVLVLPEGAPKGWRVEVPIARLREALAQHYANMASMGPLPSGAPAATPAASQLAKLLLEPVQATLKANDVTSLIISSDLNLIDVPYASLPLEGGFLGDRYAITITPSLALTSLTSTDKPPRYEKGSLIRAGASTFANGLAPLPMVEQELITIAREDGGTVLLNQDFNANRLLKVLEDPEVKRIHIASHAELKPGNETDARIYTSSSSVGLKELGELRQRSGGQSLDLVSLSACRSAVSGSELELGFAGMAIQLGAKSAIGTKWYVDDVATSSFFVQFYRYLDQGIPKAEAIQLTQKDFLSGRVRVQEDRVVGSGGSTLVTGLSPDQQRRYATGFSHPYFWAAVQLVGSPW